MGEKTARALIETYGSLDELLEDATAEQPKAGPSAASPRSERASARTPTTSARCSRSCRSTRTAPVDRWQGERDDASLDELAEELAVRGPLQRLRAALDSVAP